VAERPDFARLGDLMPAGEAGAVAPDPPQAAVSSGLTASDLSRRLAAVWVEAVGAEIAANARPVQFREGRLVVTTSSSAWAQTLHAMSEMVVTRVNQQLGDEAVKRAVFRHAGWEDLSPVRPKAGAETAGRVAASSPPVPANAGPAGVVASEPGAPAGTDVAGLTDDERRALADLEALPLDPVVKDTIRDAMTAGFVRARQDLSR
jgi:hypothetical protein